ncbi:formylmethanofuran dehydrogenase subunit C [bacterium]|nr:formylmethanofuran dehydrogenase subunit C [bacterium]
MALHLTTRTHWTLPIDLSGELPGLLAPLSPSEVGKRKLLVGREQVDLGEIFSISGSAGDGVVVWEGDLSTAFGIGHLLKEGQVTVRGSVGSYCGSQMKGGSIVVEGSAGTSVGAAMAGGTIHVLGSCGNDVGHDPRRGVGMTGGTIVVDGSAGTHVGRTIRRGTIAVRGSVGEGAVMDAIAGTVIVMGKSGRNAGSGMRRGSLFLLDDAPPEILPTFQRGRSLKPLILSLLLPHLASIGFKIDPSFAHRDMRLYHGDMLSLGLGEIFSVHQGDGE